MILNYYPHYHVRSNALIVAHIIEYFLIVLIVTGYISSSQLTYIATRAGDVKSKSYLPCCL